MGNVCDSLNDGLIGGNGSGRKRVVEKRSLRVPGGGGGGVFCRTAGHGPRYGADFVGKPAAKHPSPPSTIGTDFGNVGDGLGMEI
jgi:hypothetical protein